MLMITWHAAVWLYQAWGFAGWGNGGSRLLLATSALRAAATRCAPPAPAHLPQHSLPLEAAPGFGGAKALCAAPLQLPPAALSRGMI